MFLIEAFIVGCVFAFAFHVVARMIHKFEGQYTITKKDEGPPLRR